MPDDRVSFAPLLDEIVGGGRLGLSGNSVKTLQETNTPEAAPALFTCSWGLY